MNTHYDLQKEPMMKCNRKMMLAIALALAFARVVVYWAVPQTRGSAQYVEGPLR